MGATHDGGPRDDPKINNLPDEPMRCIRMWFLRSRYGLEPSVEQETVGIPEPANRIVRLVAPQHDGALPIDSPAEVWSSVLEARQRIEHPPTPGHVRGAMLFRVRSGRVAEMRAYVNG